MAVVIKKPGGNQPAATSTTPNAAPNKVSAGFIKKGTEAKQALKEDETKAKMKADARKRPFRFRIPQDKVGVDYKITFLDGQIIAATGELDLSIWNEHTLQVGGKWENIVCLQPDYCPVCAKAQDNSDIVAGFTVIDHTPYTIQNGDNAGKVIERQRRLYVAKRQTVGQLQKYASHYGGLRGATFMVSRSTSKAAAVGDTFMFTEKLSEDQLRELMGKDDKGNWLHLPFDYAEAAPYYSAEALADMGFGSHGNIIGAPPKADLSSEL